MGLVYGVYDAKPDGFNQGGMSLHNSYWPHGPDNEAWEAATNSELTPEKLDLLGNLKGLPYTEDLFVRI